MPQGLLDGRYRLTERIGAGGMGEVWRAHDGHLHREVAVKLLTVLTAERDPSLAARFVREARAAARLSSPHIVTVHELGMARRDPGEEVPYLVMELVRGRSLAGVISEGLPSTADTLRWAGQMCRALGTAHAAGVVHRDMKPGNVLVTGDEGEDPADRQVKVLDFGIARLLEGPGATTTLTVTGQIVGTPAYMSPEQARGDVPVDARTDLYSLGCILYELVTGRPPFQAGAWHSLLLKHIEEPPQPPGRLRPGLPPALEQLILDLLAKDPAARPATAAEVRTRLTALTAPPRGRSAQPAGAQADVRARAVAASPDPTATATAAGPLEGPTPYDTPPAPTIPAPLPRPPRTPPVPAQAPRTPPVTVAPAAPPSVAVPLAVGSVALVLCLLLVPWYTAIPVGIGLGLVNRFLQVRVNAHLYQGRHR
ncbi:protein kinase [Streptomyces sp. NPDC127190]|uniref:protein kinase domain-containing protein n=1 Tax=unclassified Streptomyces TaxID=2593676 RepID=UPI00363A5600